MKKPRIHILAVLTCVFAAFIIGFFAGRNVNRTPVQISAMPVAATAAPTEAAAETVPEETVPAIININTASAELLETLPGIGPTLAQRIIDYRTEYGPFQNTAELINVSGIGTKKLEAVLDLITVGG